MLNYNFLTNFRYWGLALEKMDHEMPHKREDFKKSMNPSTVDASVWLMEELVRIIKADNDGIPPSEQKSYNIVVLNSWLGFPLVPLICENIKVKHMDLIDIDNEALELSKVFNKNYIENGIDINHLCLDIPFAFHDINALDADIVISLGCEQMYPLRDLTTANSECIFALQSSNVIQEMYGINCVSNIEEHLENTGIKTPLYQGQVEQYYYNWEGKVFFDRFMAIGKK
jgi:hypothetical protein